MTAEGDYPSPREALSNDNKVVNAYCGLKYLIWHIGYAIMSVVGAIAVVCTAIVMVIAIALDYIFNKLIEFGKKIAPEGDSSSSVSAKIERGHESSKETPFLRRIWGECPVTIKNPPKWFEGTLDRVEKTADKYFK